MQSSPDQVSGQAQKSGARHEWDSGQPVHVAAAIDSCLIYSREMSSIETLW